MPLEMVLDIISHLNTPTDYPTKLALAQTNRAFYDHGKYPGTSHIRRKGHRSTSERRLG